MQAFHADMKAGWSLFIGEWLTLKCFMRGWCCFPRGWHPPASPLNSNTAHTSPHTSPYLPSPPPKPQHTSPHFYHTPNTSISSHLPAHPVLEVSKHLWGMVQTFHAGVKEGWSLFIRERFMLKCFRGGGFFPLTPYTLRYFFRSPHLLLPSSSSPTSPFPPPTHFPTLTP